MEGGEVVEEGLEELVLLAKYLIFLRKDKDLKGIAALKNPRVGYRQDVFTKSNSPLDAKTFPYELGWVYLDPSLRGKKLAQKLVKAALDEVPRTSVFATSRTDNFAMHKILSHFDFVKAGQDYPSKRRDYQLRLFVREISQ